MPVTIILCIIINKNNVKGFRVRAEFQRVAQVCLKSTMRLQSFFEICMIEIAILKGENILCAEEGAIPLFFSQHIEQGQVIFPIYMEIDFGDQGKNRKIVRIN